MASVPEWTHVDTPTVSNHWWWRPGWNVGTRFYAWHVTFDHAEQLHRLVDEYQAALSGIDGLDPIPRRWLHLTMQGVGHVQDVPAETVEQIASSVRRRVAGLEPIAVTFDRPVIRSEAIVIPALPSGPIEQLRASVRQGIADVLGADGVSESDDGYQPHVSLAYAHKEQPASAVRESLDKVSTQPAHASIAEVALIRMHRDHRMYEWATEATAELG